MRRPLLSIPKTEPRGRSGARLSTTRRSIQPKNKPLGNSTHAFICLFLDKGWWKRIMCLKILKQDAWLYLKVTAKLTLHFRSSTQAKSRLTNTYTYENTLFIVSVLTWTDPSSPFTTSVFVPMLFAVPPATRLTLLTLFCLMLLFRNKETLLDCEGETQLLTLPLHPATARPFYLQPHPIGRSACLSCITPPPDPLPPPLPSPPCLHSLWWCWCVSESLAGAIVSVLITCACMSAHSAWRPKEVSHLYRESRPAGVHGGKQASNSQHCGPTGRRQRDESCPIKVPNPGSAPHLFSHDHGWPARTYKCTGRTSWGRKCRNPCIYKPYMLWTLSNIIC